MRQTYVHRASCFTCATHAAPHTDTIPPAAYSPAPLCLAGQTDSALCSVPRVVVGVSFNRSAAISFSFYVFPILLNYCKRNVCRKNVWQCKNVFYSIILLTMEMKKIPLKACMYTCIHIYLPYLETVHNTCY